jgi:hypothetical protein
MSHPHMAPATKTTPNVGIHIQLVVRVLLHLGTNTGYHVSPVHAYAGETVAETFFDNLRQERKL